MPKYTLNKTERLKSFKVIDSLFSKGKSMLVYPFSVIWIEETKTDNLYPAKFTISVSKKKFKRAVKRNRIKRLTKEAYRLNKFILYDFLIENNLQIAFMLVYIEKEILSFEVIDKKMKKVLNALVESLKSQGVKN